MTKKQLFLLALVALSTTACAGMTATEVVGGITTGLGVLAGIQEALNPYLPPEAQAKLAGGLAKVDGVWQAVLTGMQVMAEESAKAKASQWSTGEMLGAGGGAAAVIAKATQVMVNRQRDQKYKPAVSSGSPSPSS